MRLSLLILFLVCIPLILASSNPSETTNHAIDTKEERMMHKNKVNVVSRRGGGGGHGGGGHGGGGGGHVGGSRGTRGRSSGTYAVPVVIGGHRTAQGHHNNASRNSAILPQLVWTTLALVLLLTY